MPEELKFQPVYQSLLNELKLQCRSQAGEDLRKETVKDQLSDSDVVAGWFEISARRLLAGDAGIGRQMQFVKPLETGWITREWMAGKGSPD